MVLVADFEAEAWMDLDVQVGCLAGIFENLTFLDRDRTMN